MAETPVLKIPNDTPVLKFLEELDGDNQRLKDAWIFLDESVIEELKFQIPDTDIDEHKGTGVSYLAHENEDRHVLTLSFARNGITNWYLINHIHCQDEDCPYKISFCIIPSIPSEMFFIVMEE